jgi:hypothetical protein
MTVEMVKGKGPHFPEPLDEPADLLVSPESRADHRYAFLAPVAWKRDPRVVDGMSYIALLRIHLHNSV